MFPREVVTAAFSKYGARGAQAVVLGYFLWRYGVALYSHQWADILRSNACQNCWMVPVPYYVITLMTPAILVVLEWWAAKAPAKNFFLNSHVEWPIVGWAVSILALVYFWLECARVAAWATQGKLPLHDDELGFNPTVPITAAYTIASFVAMYMLARIARQSAPVNEQGAPVAG